MDGAKRDAEERRYRAYVTDALMIMTENTAKWAGGRYLTRPWAEAREKAKSPEDDKTGDEIAAEFIKRANLNMKSG